jgi:hypothetical protein
MRFCTAELIVVWVTPWKNDPKVLRLSILSAFIMSRETLEHSPKCIYECLNVVVYFKEFGETNRIAKICPTPSKVGHKFGGGIFSL